MKPIIQNKKILIAPLDWGLGHAMRCMPLIKHFLQNENEVVIAADGAIEILLKNEFPDLKFIQLFNYDIQYATSAKWLWWKILKQIPHILNCVRAENKWLNDLLTKEKFDVVISDNRYGFFNKKCESIFITHQLRLQMPNGFMWLEFLTQILFEKLIKKFDQCWIPDFVEEEKSLSGKLSHVKTNLKNIVFIGILSRFENFNIAKEKEIESDILILISGPEPQRTLLEEKVLTDLNDFTMSNKKVIIIGGTLTINYKKLTLPTNVEYHNYINPNDLGKYLLGAKKIICRSGYTTIMDLVTLQKNALFVPTPGQTEQIYLAKRMAKNYNSIVISQERFTLKNY